MKRMLVDPGSVVDLLYLFALIQLGYMPDSLRNPGRILVGFNGTQTQSLRRNRATNLGESNHHSGSTNGDLRVVEFQCHIGPNLDPRDEGIALVLPQEDEFLNFVGTGVDINGDQQVARTYYALDRLGNEESVK